MIVICVEKGVFCSPMTGSRSFNESVLLGCDLHKWFCFVFLIFPTLGETGNLDGDWNWLFLFPSVGGEWGLSLSLSFSSRSMRRF